jgi:hypothetical protein
MAISFSFYNQLTCGKIKMNGSDLIIYSLVKRKRKKKQGNRKRNDALCSSSLPKFLKPLFHYLPSSLIALFKFHYFAVVIRRLLLCRHFAARHNVEIFFWF